MSEQTNTYRDSSLNLEQAYYYTLLILINGDSFSYAITNKNHLLAYEAENTLTELIEPATLQELLSAPYKNTVIGLNANGFTIIPATIFNPEHVGEFARVLDVKADEKVLAQALDENNYIVYKVAGQQLSAVNRFGLINTVFAAKGWINSVAITNPDANQLFVNIGKDKVELLNFKDSAIRFYNSFEYKNANDLAYYAALVAKEIGLQPNAIGLVLSGNVQANDVTFNTLSDFFGDVTLNQANILELPEGLNPHQLLQLAALSLCESSEVV